MRATEAILEEVRQQGRPQMETEEEALVLGATWGLVACKVPPSTRSGVGIKVAVLDTGFDLGHPDFAGRPIVSTSFVGQPVQDLHGHGTHTAGTACGPKAPAGTTPRYGIGFKASMFIGKVLQNNGFSVGGSVLNGMVAGAYYIRPESRGSLCLGASGGGAGVGAGARRSRSPRPFPQAPDISA